MFFQLSDTLTAILGGNTDKQGILTLDWTTQTYTKRKEQFNGKRWKSACAVARSSDNRDELLVFIAGGLHKESKGMEVWNPAKVRLVRIYLINLNYPVFDNRLRFRLLMVIGKIPPIVEFTM